MAYLKNMSLVVPVKITESMMFSSNVPENEHPEYDSAHSYSLGDWVQIATGGHHVEYQSTADSNLNNSPLNEVDDPDVVPFKWAKAGATNRWRMFDPRSGATTRAGLIDVQLDMTHRFNAVALLGLVGDKARITINDEVDGEVYDQEFELIDSSMIAGWWDWFYTPRRKKTDLLFRNLPNYAGATLRIRITATSGNAVIKDCVIGMEQKGGTSQYGAEIGIVDYSIKKRDTFGNLYMKERGFSRRNSLDVLVPAADVDDFNALLAEYRAQPVVFIGADGYQSMIIFGTYNKYSFLVSMPSYSVLTLDIEGYV